MDVNLRNVLAVKEFSEQTRVLLRELQEKQKQVDVLTNRITALEAQVQTLFRLVGEL